MRRGAKLRTDHRNMTVAAMQIADMNVWARWLRLVAYVAVDASGTFNMTKREGPFQSGTFARGNIIALASL